MTAMTVLGGYRLNERGELLREAIRIEHGKDYGADPVGDGTFRMVPSGDIVSPEERSARLSR